MAEFSTCKGSWPWAWIGSYCIPLCITCRPLITHQISLISKKLLCGRTDGHLRFTLLGRLGGVDLIIYRWAKLCYTAYWHRRRVSNVSVDVSRKDDTGWWLSPVAISALNSCHCFEWQEKQSDYKKRISLTIYQRCLRLCCPLWARGIPPLCLHFPTFYSICYYLLLYPFSISYSLHLFSCFFIRYHSTRIVPLGLQAGCHRRWQNLALFSVYLFCVIYIFLLRCILVFSYIYLI